MRFMMMHKFDDSSPEAWTPTPELMEEMGKLVGEMAQAGILVAGEGLRPSSVGPGARITYSSGKRTVIDGPFAEAKEVIAGFVILDVKSREEAIQWADRFAAVVGDVEVEVRKVAEAEDFSA